MAATRPRGLTAAELALAVAELRALCDAVVVDAVPLVGTDGHEDLLLVLQEREVSAKHFVHIALGGPRARIATTARRFGRDRRARGPGADVLQRELDGSAFAAVEHSPGERRCRFVFDGPSGERRLYVELFGARGLWALCDAQDTVLTMSRPVQTAVRQLRRGDRYEPPPPMSQTRSPAADSRFAPPVLLAIDAHFTADDLRREREASADELRRAAERALRKAQHKADGLRRQLADAGRADRLRQTADLMLAYAHAVRRGATRMDVPALDGNGTTTIELDPTKPVTVQANALYDKARRMDDGREVTEQRLARTDAEVTELQDALALLVATATDEQIEQARERLQGLGALPRERKPNHNRQPQKAREVPFRRYTSLEGYPVFVGRNNAQNDELTMRFANGNDLWLHVGGGRPGSHVVVRLPRNKTASLETLLDAATLAVHFSKARGEPRVDVIYTFRKHVRKPKGLPPGAVVPAHTKTITVLRDPNRLQRLLRTEPGTNNNPTG